MSSEGSLFTRSMRASNESAARLIVSAAIATSVIVVWACLDVVSTNPFTFPEVS